MSGIDFADTIVVRRVINKGTTVVEEPLKKSSWTGSDFKKSETDRLKLAGDLMIMSGKGTTKIRLSEMKQPKTVLPRGYYITTGKGTGRMKLE